MGPLLMTLQKLVLLSAQFHPGHMLKIFRKFVFIGVQIIHMVKILHSNVFQVVHIGALLVKTLQHFVSQYVRKILLLMLLHTNVLHNVLQVHSQIIQHGNV